MASIYGLYDGAGALRYIGKANDPEKRLKGHMREVRRRRTPLYDWIAKHGVPEMRVLESDCVDWRDSERRLITAARQAGAALLNLADGGDEPFCSAETRRANGLRLVERIRSDPKLRRLREVKRHLSSALRQGLVANETRAKIRLLATKSPSMFGVWANLPDREEAPDGTPVTGYR